MKKFLFSLIALFSVVASYAQCPDLSSARKSMGSSFHSSVIIAHDSTVTYWGDAASTTATASNVTSPLVLSGYTGAPLSVAAGSVSASQHQLYLHTSTNLYGWGYSNRTIRGATPGHTAFSEILLPPGVTIDRVSFIEAAGGALAIVTHSGAVYIKDGGVTGSGTALVYGDGTASFDTLWHKVSTSAAASDTLTGVVRFSLAGRGAMALTASGSVYVWGDNVFLGDGSGSTDLSYATLVTNPAGVTPADVNIITMLSYSGTWANASQFILGTDGRLYGTGENYRGILGQGHQVDSTRWVAVKGPAGVGTLDNIVLLGSNNAYPLSYSVGALTSDGKLYLWGDNSYDMIGGDTLTSPSLDSSYYTVPRMPPNFTYNNVRIGYFEMGGHTTAAFLSGTNKFCYIGHKIRGSMGDGIATESTRKAFDCINTPDAFICPPAAASGCPLPTASDLVASSIHATLVINGQPSVTFWGEAASSAEPGISMPDPKILYEYNGSAIGVAASGVSVGSAAQGTQMWLHTTQGIWGWGYSANTVQSNRVNSAPITQAPLPAGVNASDISFIRSARGGLALVTTSGHVWVRAGAGSACSPDVYGDASASLDAAGSTGWHQVTTAAATPLTGVIELSFAGTAALAITSSGQAYVWGNNTYLGDGSVAANRNRAALMTLHADFTGTVVPRTAEIIQAGSLEAVQFILGSNNRIYSLGRNANGALGIGSSTYTDISTSWNILSLVGVRKLTSNNPFADGFYSVAALTLTGNVYLWGENRNGMLGFPIATTSVHTPTVATTIATNDATNFEMSGYHTIIFVKSTSQFYFAGRSRGGSRGDGAPNADYTPFTLGATVTNCAGAAFSMSGHLYNDNNGLKNNLVDGTAISTVRTTPMHANLLDAAGIVLATTPVSSGAFAFNNFPVANYYIQISPTAGTLFAAAPANTLPANWVFTGEQIGINPGTGIDTGAPNGLIRIPLAANISNINFGVQQLPAPVSDTMNTMFNPGGTNTVSIAAGFTGIDTLGTIDSIRITDFPSNVTSIRIGSTMYTSGTWPVSGVTYATGTAVDIDPVDGAVRVVVPFRVIDNAGFLSPASATLTIPFVEVPPVANNITALRINSSAVASPIPQLQASSPVGTPISTYRVLTLPPVSEGVLYYCASAPATCSAGSLTAVSTSADLSPAQAASLYFDPVQTFTGIASFTYRATDTNSLISNTATYRIPVYNNPPVTPNITIAQVTNTNGPTNLSDLIGADVDGVVDSFVVSGIPPASQGILTYCSNGTDTCTGTVITISGAVTLSPAQMRTLKMDPDSFYTGNYVYEYQAKDNNGNLSNVSTYTIPVVGTLGGNLPPVATNIIAQNINNSLGATPIPNLLGTDPDGTIAGYTIGAAIPDVVSEGTLYYCPSPGSGCALSPVTAGMSLSTAQAHTLQFDPVEGFIGTAGFTYTVTDNLGAVSAVANYYIPVVNTPPVANPTGVNAMLNTITTPVQLSPLSGNDADGTVTSYNITTVPPAGQGTLQYCISPGPGCALTTIATPLSSLTPAQAASLHFIPNSSFTGNYVFEFTVVDNNNLLSLPATYTIPVVDAPTATGEPPVAQSYNSAPIHSSVTADLGTALEGTDPDGTIISYTVTSIPAANHGTLTYCTTPPATGCSTPVAPGLVMTPTQATSLSFTPDANFRGIATFNYTTTDNDGNTSNTATVTVPVVNNPPVSSNVNNAAISRMAGPTTLNPLSSVDDDGTIVNYTILTIPTPDQGLLALCTTPPGTGCTPVSAGQVLTPAEISRLVFTPDTSVHSPVVSFFYSATDNSGLISNAAVMNIPFTDAIPLPLSLLGFDATKAGSNARIHWSAAREEELKAYHLMHSVNGVDWDMLHQQTPYRTINVNMYDYVHENLSGSHFYRLKLIGFDGSVSYSNIKMLNFELAQNQIALKPNPFTDQVSVYSGSTVNISELTVMNVSGKVVKVYHHLKAGDMLDLSGMNSGVYFVKIVTGNNEVSTFKLVKM